MAESVDALVSNTSGREAVPVRPRLRVLKGLLLQPFLRTRSQSAAKAASLGAGFAIFGIIAFICFFAVASLGFLYTFALVITVMTLVK